MTKSDYKKFIDDNFVFLAVSDAYSLIDYIFEKGIEDKKTCGSCKYWHEKSCMNNDSIAYCAPNAVYEDDYCKDYEAIQ